MATFHFKSQADADTYEEIIMGTDSQYMDCHVYSTYKLNGEYVVCVEVLHGSLTDPMLDPEELGFVDPDEQDVYELAQLELKLCKCTECACGAN